MTERDEAWFRQTYRDHHRAILAYAVRRVGADAADDVVAEVFATAWRQRDRVPDPPLPWLYRTAGHHVLHRYRSVAREYRLTQRLGSQLDPRAMQDRYGEIDDGALVRDVLARLPERDADVLMLAVWEDLDPAAIAEVLGCTAVAARVRLHRARRRAKALLADDTPPAHERSTGDARALRALPGYPESCTPQLTQETP